MRNVLNKSFFIIIFLIGSALLMSSFIYKDNHFEITDFSTINLDKAKKLMIVAHPDDETIWGGAHLLEDDYLVVCITCGQDEIRVKEFEKVMSETNDQYIMLGFPDKVLGVRSEWTEEKPRIKNYIKEIVELKDWDLIVTHNQKGEYGHNHHIMTNEIVTDVYNEKELQTPLYYFGKYYSKAKYEQLEEKPPVIKQELYDIKVNKLIEIYESQSFITEKFGQMFNHEDWTQYIKE